MNNIDSLTFKQERRLIWFGVASMLTLVSAVALSFAAFFGLTYLAYLLTK
jgi:hypothetical protein